MRLENVDMILVKVGVILVVKDIMLVMFGGEVGVIAIILVKVGVKLGLSI